MKLCGRQIGFVDLSTGEQLDDEAAEKMVEELIEVEVKGLRRSLRAETFRLEQLRKKINDDVKEEPEYAPVKEIFDFWRHATGRKRSKFTPDRFWLILPYYKRFGQRVCRLAIAGAAYDCFEPVNKNGLKEPKNRIDDIFKNTDRFEAFARKAPRQEIERYMKALREEAKEAETEEDR